MDKFTPEKRSKIMSAIRSRDTLPEIVIRKWLFAHGFRFRVCDRKIVGHPDIVLRKYRTLIEIRGCFWHRHGWTWDGRKLVRETDCPQATVPKSNRAFWNGKFRKNVRRDLGHERLWREQGWNVIVIWECELKTAAAREETFARLEMRLRRPSGGGTGPELNFFRTFPARESEAAARASIGNDKEVVGYGDQIQEGLSNV